MVESVKATTYAVACLDSKAIIVKLVEDHLNVQLAQNLVRMEHVNQTTSASVIQDGLESCAIRINLGLEELVSAMLRYITYLPVIYTLCTKEWCI